MSGGLSDLHLAEGRLHDGFASGVVGPTGLGPESPGHPFALRGVVRNPAAWGVRDPLLAADPSGGDEGVALRVGDLLEVGF